MEKTINEMVIEELENEIRDLQVVGNMNGDLPTSVAPIVDKLESVSTAYYLARKILFRGQFLKLPIEGNLDNATFVPENTNVPSINLYLNGTAQLRGDKRLGVAITVTKNMMEDSAIDLKDYIESLLVERIGSALEQSIFNGDGSQLGFLGIAKDTNVVSSPLNINAATIDQLRAIQNLVHDKALPNSVWYMNRTFFNEVTRLQDGNKNYYVSYQSGVPYLLGSPIEITGGLAADTASGNIPVVYGDISMGYTCGIAKEIESYTTSSTADALRGTVTFTVYMLVDGCVTNYAALAVGKVA